MVLHPCTTCRRHVRVDESSCPFCRATLTPRAIEAEPDVPMISLNNMIRIQRDLLVIFRIAAVKEYTRSPVSYWPASTGVVQYNSSAKGAAGVNGFVASNNGSPEAQDIRKLASPLYVAGGVVTQSGRLLADAHWFSDVLAGSLLGTSGALCCLIAARALRGAYGASARKEL